MTKGRGRPGLLALALALSPSLASAHPIPGLEAAARPGWTLDPAVTVPLALAAALFGAGWVRLHRRSALGRRELGRRGGVFAAGWCCLAAALVSPLHQAGERSFAAHMVEHETLMLAAAPLLVLSRPLAVMLWAFPAGGRRALGGAARTGWIQAPWRALTEPFTATFLQAAALWLWHVPGLFDLALGSAGWHVVQHLCFLVTALLFWSAVLPAHQRKRLARATACLFITSIVTGALGAFMAFSASPWYARYAALGMDAWGLSPAEDQQLAGLLMWIPGGLVHAAAALVLLWGALNSRSASGGTVSSADRLVGPEVASPRHG